MADMESLSLTTDACKGTLASASKAIRSLILERNAALAAADPAMVAAMQKETEVFQTAATLRADLEAARVDTEHAIAEATAAPVLPAKSLAAQFPKTLGDSTPAKRPDVKVNNAMEESAARVDGFTVQILPTAAPPAQ